MGTFQHLVGDGIQMKNVPTPFARESPGPAYAPSQEGDWLMCPFCTGCYSPEDLQKGNTDLPAAVTKKMRERIQLAIIRWRCSPLPEEAQQPRAPLTTDAGVFYWTINGLYVIEPKFQRKKLHMGSCVTAEVAQQPRPLPCPVLHGAICPS